MNRNAPLWEMALGTELGLLPTILCLVVAFIADQPVLLIPAGLLLVTWSAGVLTNTMDMGTRWNERKAWYFRDKDPSGYRIVDGVLFLIFGLLFVFLGAVSAVT